MTGSCNYNDNIQVNPEGLIRNLQTRIETLEAAIADTMVNVQGSKKRRFRGKTQLGSLGYGFTRAICAETIDPWKENRIRFYHPLLHDPETPVLGLPFARPISSMGGFDDCGLNWVPPAGSTVALIFDNGARDAPFYIGTCWHRDRGPGGAALDPVPMREWKSVSKGHRKGYLVGPDDESQVLPPWNTESYNGFDINFLKEFALDPTAQKRITYPNIYGFKTPEKHMLKMTDGNAKCNRRWKRFEIQSGCGNYMIFKDDHIHYGGQWAHPSCKPEPGGPDVDICSEHTGDLPYFTDIHGKPIEKESLCEPGCVSNKGVSCSKILIGHPSSPTQHPPHEDTTYPNTNTGVNPFFKHENECRPVRGPGTPQNNKLDLPQSGIQFLSISGHTLVMDDSVEEPRGKPEWERSLENFDFGCNDKFLGLLYMKSTTGHVFAMSDVEEKTGLRGVQNYIELHTASGNRLELNDETIADEPCVPCPPNIAGERRGVHIESTSEHIIKMIDNTNRQCSPCRKEGGVPTNLSEKAYIQIRSGYGLEMRYNDDNWQRETQRQWIQITHPQCARAPQCTDVGCQSEECCRPRPRGPHFMRFQGRPCGQPGIVFLRVGGHSIRYTYDNDIVLVGDKDRMESDKFTYVSRNFTTATEKVHFRYAGDLHVFFAENFIFLMAGRDCPPVPPDGICKGPCLYPVIIGRCPVTCSLTGIIHWTEKALSERVFASGHHPCQEPPDCGSDCEKYETSIAEAPVIDCEPPSQEELDVGSGNPAQTGAQRVGGVIQ